MGFAQLKKRINEKTEKEADQIVKSAHKEAEEAKRKLEIEMEEKEKQEMEEAKATIDMIEKRELASAGLEAKKKKLIAKKELMEKAFAEAKDSINKYLNKKDRKELIEKLLKRAEKEIDVEKVYCNKIDAELVKDKKVEQRDMLGGIIAEDKSGEVVIDYSFETLLEEIKNSRMSEIADILVK
ncbi:MAG: V-type ATP synthase subunit E [Candidatus Nanoarchaeia archaeon]